MKRFERAVLLLHLLKIIDHENRLFKKKSYPACANGNHEERQKIKTKRSKKKKKMRGLS